MPDEGDLGWGEGVGLVDEVAEGALQGQGLGGTGEGDGAGVLVAEGAGGGGGLVSMVRTCLKPSLSPVVPLSHPIPNIAPNSLRQAVQALIRSVILKL